MPTDADASASAWRLTAPPKMSTMAADALRAMILGGEFAPGERLVESRLTEQLGVSRPPVREALKDLQHQGLVVPDPQRGLVVRELSQHDVYEIVTLRDQLEQMALRLALPEPDPARLAELRSRLADLEAADPDDDASDAAMVRLGFAFHETLVSLAEHARLLEAYRTLQWQVQLCMSLNVTSRRSHESARGNAARHRTLVEAIETGDVETALRALRAHGHDSFLQTLARDLPGGSRASRAWLERQTREGDEPAR